MSNENVRRILVIDDNPAIHGDFKKILDARSTGGELDAMEASILGAAAQPASSSRQQYEIAFAYQGEEGFNLVRQSLENGKRFALAFVDMRMPPGWDGIKTIEKIWEVDDQIQIVICTAYSDYSWDDINKRFGAGDRLLILKKPFDTAEVCQLACALTEKWLLGRHSHLKLNQLRAMVEEQTAELEMNNRRLTEEIEQRRNSEARYRLAETGANDGLWDWDLTADKVYYSTRWKAMLGYEDNEIGDSPDEWINRIHPEDVQRLKADQQGHFEGRSQQLRGEYRIMHKDGQFRWVLCRGVVERDKRGIAVRAAGSFTDITDRKMAEEQLRFDALHDSLTGLANRARLSARLSHCLARVRREAETKFAVLYMDLDHFKVINDSLGHLMGDKLLVEVGRRLTLAAREVDLLARPGQDHVARIGGDEFVLLLESIRDESDALRVSERLHTALAAPFTVDGHDISTSVSIGITLCHNAYEKAEDILRDADTALYEAKAHGKGCTRLFDPAMHDRAMTRWRTETELRHAIDHDEIILYYQPILAASGQLASFEALARWQHPTRGLLSPDLFIPIAEDSGLIVQLGRCVTLAACKQLRKWQVRFPSQQALSVAVNVSSKQFALAGIGDEIARILAETGLSPQCLRLEITESAAMKNADQTIQTLSLLNAMGTLIDVDDFGTGYSSLSYLHRMPIHALKIDRGFVGPMCKDKMSRSIVQAIANLAHSLNLRVVAEGVETARHLDEVILMGCDYIQGFHISKPLTVDQTTEFIARHTGQAPLAASG